MKRPGGDRNGSESPGAATHEPRQAKDMALTLAAALRTHGADIAFGVPGGGPNLDMIGAMTESGIRFVLAHGETSACIMASVYGYLTGRLAATVVTRGPGAASAVNGAAQATLDRHPLALITDTVPSASADRVVHQRIDQRSMMQPVSKTSARIGGDVDQAELERLLSQALDAPAGAIHLDYDLSGPSQLPEHQAGRSKLSDKALPIGPSDELLLIAKDLLWQAEKPVVIVGVGALGFSDLSVALESLGVPVLTTYQAVGAVSSEHALNGGLFTNGASERPLLSRADLIITIGLDPVEPIPAPWPYESPVLSLAETPTTEPYVPIAVELIGPLPGLAAFVVDSTDQTDFSWAADAGAAHRELIRSSLAADATVPKQQEVGNDDSTYGTGVTPVALVKTVAEAVPEGLTTTVDAGAHFLAVMPFWQVMRTKTLLISNGLATMGYAVPAAIAAALARPGLPVLCFVGDGGLGMTLAELETIARLRLPITVVVFNDSALSLIQIKQREDHGGSAVVSYRNTDFAALAETMGLPGTSAANVAELEVALEACSWSSPRLIDVQVDPAQYPHLIQVTRG